MAKKKTVEAEGGLKNVAVTVGSALGKFAAKIGLGEAAAPPVRTPAKTKSTAPSKKKVAAKKVAVKRASMKKAAGPAKKK